MRHSRQLLGHPRVENAFGEGRFHFFKLPLRQTDVLLAVGHRIRKSQMELAAGEVQGQVIMPDKGDQTDEASHCSR